MKLILKAGPDIETTYIPKNKFRKMMHILVNHYIFQIFIMVCIVLNMVQMAITFEGSSNVYDLTLDYINLTFTVIFTIE
jgi:hypothetical protein